MDERAYEAFTDQLKDGLMDDTRVVGLITLGSTADVTQRDEWSDHDFWVITHPGAQSYFRDEAGWLPAAEDILLTARHGLAYRTVLYRNRHKIEYAVFDRTEARG